DRPGAPDVRVVACDDAAVDDVGVEAREVEDGAGLHEVQRDASEHHPTVRAEAGAQQADQHGRPRTPSMRPDVSSAADGSSLSARRTPWSSTETISPAGSCASVASAG